MTGAALLMLGWPALAAPARTLHIALCQGGSVEIPIGPKDGPHKKDCPAGCHAPICQSRKRPGARSV